MVYFTVLNGAGSLTYFSIICLAKGTLTSLISLMDRVNTNDHFVHLRNSLGRLKMFPKLLEEDISHQ